MGSKVQSLVRELGRNDRLAVMMFYVDELSPLEIGVVLGIPTLEVSRTLDAFRDQVGDLMDEQAAMPTLKLVRA